MEGVINIPRNEKGEKVNLYLTADLVGIETGGGLVTKMESDALKELGECHVLSRDNLTLPNEPFEQDEVFRLAVKNFCESAGIPRLVHCYSGCLSNTVAYLKSLGSTVVYTIAAHDREQSKQEHETYGISFDYPHLTQELLWQRYIAGYLASDVIVCPSTVAAETVRKYPFTGRIEVIEHGCTLPDAIHPLPAQFTVGYLGACGAPDKGLIYLFQAWKNLNYRDAKLILAGPDSTSAWTRHLIEKYGGGIVDIAGRVNKPGDLYNQISLYIQVSVTEGFGIPVLEAMAHGRPAICSLGAGASDVVPDGFRFAPRDVTEITKKIHAIRGMLEDKKDVGTFVIGSKGYQEHWQKRAETYTWSRIRERYKVLWRELLGQGAKEAA